MDPTEIDDARLEKDFKDKSFSGYKKCDVKKELIENLLKSRVENSCYWSAELVCSGNFMDLWEIILLYTCKHIHVGNPKLPIYIDMRFNTFKAILKCGYVGNEISMRNHANIRKLFCEIISVLCLSTKKHSFEKLKVKNEDFDMTSFSDKLKAPNVKFIEDIFSENDPKEIFIPLNELSYNIYIGNSVQACYWIEWIMEFESKCKKKKEKCEGSFRTFPPVENKYQNDIIWIIWDLLNNKLKDDSEALQKIMKSLLNLYCIRYAPTVKKRRVYILYYAVSLCCDRINLNTNIFKDKELIDNVCNKVDLIYKEIKKNEHSTNTGYLFNNKHEKSNREKTIERLNKINNLGSMVPRNEVI